MESIARAAAEKITVGDPADEATTMGPQVSEPQWQNVQNLIQKGIDEGAELIFGGLGKPDGV